MHRTIVVGTPCRLAISLVAGLVPESDVSPTFVVAASAPDEDIDVDGITRAIVERVDPSVTPRVRVSLLDEEPVTAWSTGADALWVVLGGRPDLEAPMLDAILARPPSKVWMVLARHRQTIGGQPRAQVLERARAQGIRLRTFLVGPVLDDVPWSPEPEADGLQRLLVALHGVRGELADRLPAFFDYQALRLLGPPSAPVDLVDARAAAAFMLHVARRATTEATGPWSIRSPRPQSLARLCEHVGLGFELGLLAEDDPAACTAVDRLLQARMGSLDGLLLGPDPAHHAPARPETQGFDLERLFVDEARLRASFEATRRHLDRRVTARRARADRVLEALDAFTLERGDDTLTYVHGGSGTVPVVLVNAIGQGLHYWCRIVDDLLRRGRRVLLWQPRGIDGHPESLGLRDHVDDLEAILRHEGIEVVDLVGWCTGPKVAVELCRRHPSWVRALVFLNPTFKCEGSPDELDTDYERSLLPLCRMIEHSPSMVGSVLELLRSSVAGDELDPEQVTDPQDLADGVLGMMNRDLRPHVDAPFRSPRALVGYAHQVLDLWTYDVREHAANIDVPVLIVTSEHDRVASAPSCDQVAPLFPRATQVRVQGATHYCLYDRPALLGELMESFLRDFDFTAAASERGELLEVGS